MKKTVLNLRGIFLIIFLCILGYLCFEQKDIDFLGIVLLGSIIVFFSIAISPIAVTFSKDFLTIYYFFGIKEEIKWTHIRKIEKIIADKRPDHWHFWCYHIYLRKKSDKKPFFAVGEIPANFMTRKLLYEYYKPNFDKKK